MVLSTCYDYKYVIAEVFYLYFILKLDDVFNLYNFISILMTEPTDKR